MNWLDDPNFNPDPKRTTVHRGVIFNPWINIPVCIVGTILLAAATVWCLKMYADVSVKPAYEDQGLDVIGAVIGVIAFGLATIAMFIATIWTIVWWARRASKHRDGRDPDSTPR